MDEHLSYILEILTCRYWKAEGKIQSINWNEEISITPVLMLEQNGSAWAGSGLITADPGHIFAEAACGITHCREFFGKEENICCMEISAGSYGNTLSNSMENLRSCQAKF